MVLEVSHIEPAATDAILVYLQPPGGEPLPYEAGQFLTFRFDQHGTSLYRSYSICTTPGIDRELAIVIKKVTNGAISRWLIAHLKQGDMMEALPPAGRFTLIASPDASRTLIFVAAGSGISPVFSLLKKVLFTETHARAVLIYQNHDEEATIFKAELEALQESFPDRLTVIFLYSKPISAAHIPQRLNNTLLEALLSLYVYGQPDILFYVCGPPDFMRLAQFVIRLMGFGQEQIKKENFTIEAPPPPPLLSDRSPKQVVLRRNGKEYHFTVAYPVNILQAALDNGIQLPYSCRGGRCSTCTLRCVSGTVKMSINEVLTDKDLASGLCLVCVGFAETDVVLE